MRFLLSSANDGDHKDNYDGDHHHRRDDDDLLSSGIDSSSTMTSLSQISDATDVDVPVATTATAFPRHRAQLWNDSSPRLSGRNIP